MYDGWRDLAAAAANEVPDEEIPAGDEGIADVVEPPRLVPVERVAVPAPPPLVTVPPRQQRPPVANPAAPPTIARADGTVMTLATDYVERKTGRRKVIKLTNQLTISNFFTATPTRREREPVEVPDADGDGADAGGEAFDTAVLFDEEFI
jgi:hypothetical protein